MVSPPNNLPQPPTTLVGRAAELAQLKRDLRAARLLTLTGPGGCGKTRLALEIAAELLPEFQDGVWWCDLTAVTDQTYLPQSVASVLRLTVSPERAALDVLLEKLEAQRALLILDNCEHLLSACAALAQAVLQTCPGVQILATSLQPLGLPLERAWPVPPLALPDPSATAAPEQADAMRLFAERAARVLPSFQLTPENRDAVAAICRRLDGQPLALELAAARVKLLTLEQIDARLDDVLSLLTRGSLSQLRRHQTLRAALDWSYQFLTAPEQVLLRRLSVFAGSFTLEMAEAICGEGLAQPGVLDLLTDLVEKSFISADAREADGEPRFHMLETIRQHSREKLEAAGETAVSRTRHLDWFAGLVQQIEPKLSGPEARSTLARLDADVDNLRVALQWVRTSRAVEPGLQLAGGLWMFWQSRGYFAEGRNWLEEFLAMQGGAAVAPIAPLVRTKALYAAAVLAFRQTDYPRAAVLAEASLSAAHETQDPARIGVPLSLLAILATEQGDYARAAAMQTEALRLYRGLGDRARVSNTLINLGVIARRQAAYPRAVELYEEALTLKRQMGDKLGAATALSNLGETAVIQGKLARAVAVLDESLLLYGELGNKAGTVAVLNNLGVVARQQGAAAQARAHFDEALGLCQAMGDTMRASLLWVNLGDLARDEGNWARAQTLYADALAQLQGMGDMPGSALALHSLGLVAAGQQDDEQALAHHQASLELYRSAVFPLGMVEALEAIADVSRRRGRPQRAARWLGVAEAQREAMGAPVARADLDRHESCLAALRQALGEERLAALRADGRAGGLERAVAEALETYAAPASAEAAPEPQLRILALGPTRVYVGERALASSDWMYTKSKELLIYLLAHPSATKAQIGTDLWPAASADQLRSFFHSALHHLRRALGKPEWIRFEAGEYAFNRDLPFEYDVQAFEDHLRQAQTDARSPAQSAGRARAIAHLEAAANLWRGDYLADVDAGEWALYRREALRQALLNALLQLADLHFAEARYPAAAETYQRALAFDNYLEVAHRGLMRCYARQGEAGRAARHFQDLQRLLQAELRTSPSAETMLLYERIRRGDDV